MKFEFLFEDVNSEKNMDESKLANVDTFYEWTKTAGKTIYDICDKDITLASSIPGIGEFKKYLDGATGQDNDTINLVLSLQKQYKAWINEVLDPQKANKIYKETKIWIKDHSVPGIRGPKPGSKNKPNDNTDKITKGLDFKPTQSQTLTSPETSVASEIPKEKKKYYKPTGNPRGRRPGQKNAPKDVTTKIEPSDISKVSLSNEPNSEPTMVDFMNQMKAMQNQIEQLKKRLGENPANDEDKIYESKSELKKQYQRFL
jgi:hypothetical protein